jgi:hypothetical protein
MRYELSLSKKTAFPITGYVVTQLSGIAEERARRSSIPVAIGLSAIGKSLREQYDTLSPSNPPRFATLVERLETRK